MGTKVLYRVVARKWIAGLEAENGIVTRTTPFLAWAQGRTMSFVYWRCSKQNWEVTRVPDCVATLQRLPQSQSPTLPQS